MKKRTLTTVLAVGATSLAMATPVLAVEDTSGSEEMSTTSVVEEVQSGDEYATYGYSLDATQKESTKALLKAEEVLPSNEIIVTPERYVGVFGGDASEVGNIYSSARITFGEENSGIDVEIVTPENIQKVSENDYINAAITSGMSDVDIAIASTEVVTGEGGLAGIYVVQQQLGKEIDPEVVALTDEELALNGDLESEVAGENADATSEEADALTNGLLADIKNEVAKLVQESKGEVSEEQSRDIVINIVNNYGLNLSEETIQRLVDFALAFSKTDVALDPEVQEQLAQLGGKLQEVGGDIWQGVQSTVSDPEFQESAGNLWDAIVDFFTNLFSGFTTANDTQEQ